MTPLPVDDDRDPALMLDYIHWLEGVIYDCCGRVEYLQAGYPEAMWLAINASVEARMKDE